MMFESDFRNEGLSQVAVGVLLTVDSLQVLLLYQNIDAFLKKETNPLNFGTQFQRRCCIMA